MSVLPEDNVLISDQLILQQLKPGDHICSERMNDNYKHHGIYVGNNRVIHFQGPHKVIYDLVACDECHYKPKRVGTVVETCVDCFRVGHSLNICEYGIHVSGVIESWVSEKLNADGIIYTFRKGKVYLGIWTDKKTVIHLAKPRYGWVGSSPCHECDFQAKRNLQFLLRKKYGSMVETCLNCFLRGGLMFINEHRLHVTGSDTDTWISYNNYDFSINETPFILRRKLKTLLFSIFKHMKVPFGKESSQKGNILVYKDKRVQVYGHQSGKPADQVVTDAKRYLRDQFGTYNLFKNNCEHFAFTCKTDIARSIQVSHFRRKFATYLILTMLFVF
ncbi:hypothetical protein QQ045_022084 [Rhodiola kirilowii]